MKKFSIKPMVVAVAAASFAGTAPYLYAQDDDTRQAHMTEEVVVTGFARSIKNSIDIKRDADTVIQAISAADLSGLPDVSIADALGRLPGVTVAGYCGVL